MGLLAGTDMLTQLARIVAIYLFTLVMLRIAGKRRAASLSPFDILIIIALGSAVGDAMVYPDSVVSLQGAMLVVFSVIALQIIVSKLTEHNELLSFLVHGKGTDVIRNGSIIWENLENEDLTEDELMELLREKGVGEVSKVKEAVLEKSGDLGIILYEGSGRRPMMRRKRLTVRRR